jgi:prepilin-type processing-associated H-X9-DG protein
MERRERSPRKGRAACLDGVFTVFHAGRFFPSRIPFPRGESGRGCGQQEIPMKRCERGLTVVEVIAVVAVVLILVAMSLFLNGRPRHNYGRQLKDQTHVRGIVQAMQVWAQNNGDRYPMPSLVDKDNATVADLGAAKDTTANVFSILIYDGCIPTEMCVSPAESNGKIEVCTKYAFEKPPTAVNPEKALWDPVFNADFTGDKPSHLSYANMQPFGAREKRWGSTMAAADAQVGNRGPEIREIQRRRNSFTTIPVLKESNTYLIHGGRKTWEGNIGYADGHTNFETSMIGDDPKVRPHYEGKSGRTPDCLFFDEPDDVKRDNVFMSIFTKAGAEAKDWKAIWD